MNMLRHDYISGDVEPVPFPCVFEGLLKDIPGACCAQTRCAIITAESHEMQAAHLLISLQTPGHVRMVVSCARELTGTCVFFATSSGNGKSTPPPCRTKHDKGRAPASGLN